MNFFTLGSMFSSFEALKAALIQYKQETNVEFFIRDCKTLKQSTRKGVKSAVNANPDLYYHRLKLYCVRGGRPFISSITGQRNRTSYRLGCGAYIYLSLSHCKQYLEVKDYDFEHNHEMEPRPLQRKEARAEKRRQRLMKKLNLSYAEILQLEKRKSQKEEELSLLKDRGPINNENDVMNNQYSENDVMDSQCSENDVINNHCTENDVMNNQSSENDVMENQCSENDVNNMLPENDVNDQGPEQIYTRTGDDGMSATFNGARLYKDHKIFEAVGTIEELSSAVGFAIEFFPESCQNISAELREIQCVLQDLVVHVGTPKSVSTAFHRVNSDFPVDHVTGLENHIAKYTERLPNLNDIILPSGGKGSSSLHVARSICRRAERRVACLVREDQVNQSTIQYLNRLGDYLFAVARVVCICDGEKERIYEKPKIPKPLRKVRKLYFPPVSSVLTVENVENNPFQGCEIIYFAQPEE